MRSFVLLALCALAAAVTSPSFNAIRNIEIRQNDPTQLVSLNGIKAGDAKQSTVEFFATSSNQELIPDESIEITYLSGSTATTGQLRFTPLAGKYGVAKITVTIYGEGSGQVLLSVKDFEVKVIQTDVDCGYSAWGTWSMCDQPCNGGRQTRSRSIATQPMGDGAKCVFNDQIETQTCNQQACMPPTIKQVLDVTINQDSGSAFVELAGISAGQGEVNQDIVLSVESSNPNLLRFQSSDIVYKSPATSGMLWFTPNPGQSGASRVTVTVTDSGTGTGALSSYTSSMSFTVNVVPLPVDCITEFASWSACSSTCGDGTRTREMVIKRPAMSNGRACPSPLPRDTEACYTGACPVDCQKTWSEWQPCSVSCGTGVKTRYELITAFPQDNGEPCGNLDTQQRPCQLRGCPVDCVQEWGEWSTCSVSCGTGVQTRKKSITTQPSGDGQLCQSPTPTEERPCYMSVCPKPNDCQVDAWTEWSVCGTDCHRVRNRRIVAQAKQGGTCVALKQEEACKGEMCVAATSRNSCQGLCNTAPESGRCGCDAECERYQDCCSDYQRVCGSSVRLPAGSSCQGRCGGPGLGGNCHCDQFCTANGDCCADYATSCGSMAGPSMMG